MTRSSRFLISISLASLLCTTAEMCPSTGVKGTEPGEDVEKALFTFSKLRNTASQLASSAKIKFKDKAELLKASEQKYNVAAAQGNAFIDALQLAVTERKKKVQFKKESEDLAKAVEELQETVEPGQRLVSIGLAEVIEGIAKGAVVIWKAYKDQQGVLIEEVKKELDKRRWSKWSEA